MKFALECDIARRW